MCKHDCFTVANVENLFEEERYASLALRCIVRDAHYRETVLHVLNYAEKRHLKGLEKALAYLLDEQRRVRSLFLPEEKRQALIDNWDPSA